MERRRSRERVRSGGGERGCEKPLGDAVYIDMDRAAGNWKGKASEGKGRRGGRPSEAIPNVLLSSPFPRPQAAAGSRVTVSVSHVYGGSRAQLGGSSPKPLAGWIRLTNSQRTQRVKRSCRPCIQLSSSLTTHAAADAYWLVFQASVLNPLGGRLEEAAESKACVLWTCWCVLLLHLCRSSFYIRTVSCV
jgi:hypothetical protein